MAGTAPKGDPAPADGRLPANALHGIRQVPLGFYLHVPFCVTRCGYCDFNTYTAAELGGPMARVSPANLGDYLKSEIRLARSVLGPQAPQVATVFIGGGTPTLMEPRRLGDVLCEVAATFGLAPDAEVTIEANPESVDPEKLAGFRAAGCNRISIGMQSAVPRVLGVLERAHSPGSVARAVRGARSAGFDDLSLDLIYGAPTETLAEWRDSVEMALDLEPDHVSAYALIVEEGTRLAAAIRRGRSSAPDDDLMADKYLLADKLIEGAGMSWYELSNWSRPGHECRHNLGYWHSANWWGAGPGSHSHVGGIRWWNRRHPADWAHRLAEGLSPAAAKESVDEPARETERVMLESRLATGIELRTARQWRVAAELDREGLGILAGNRVVLTLAGRLLADAVVLRML